MKGKKGTLTEYRGIKYRSKWEVYIAKLFLYSDIRTIYEPKRFFLTKTLSYLPDFYLPDYNFYVEVKGLLSKKDSVLLSIFSGFEKIIYLGKNEITLIHGKSASELSRIDIVKYIPTKLEIFRFKELIFKLMNK